MIELWSGPSPNGMKVAIFLEEAGMEYVIKPVNIVAGEQFSRPFLEISPNNKMPGIIDQHPQRGDQPVRVFESAAILQYLAEKTGKFLSFELHARYETIQWLIWQVAGLGPNSGQCAHFKRFSPEKESYAAQRFSREVSRLYAVADHRLRDRDFFAGEYSIADMACYPFMVAHQMLDIDIGEFPNLGRWLARVSARPAIERAAQALNWRPVPPPANMVISPEIRARLAEQSAESVRREWVKAGF